MTATPARPDQRSCLPGVMALIGRTPLLEIRYCFEGRPRRLFAKYEALNMTGSVKDRMAVWILRRACEAGELPPDAVIVEASSGNTGISFSALGRALGHRVRIYMPDWLSQERTLLIRSLGAEVIHVSAEQGGFLGSIRLAEEFAAQHQGPTFLPRQFENAWNVEAHERMTGPEIEAQLASRGLSADGLVAGVGTGGTIMGVGRYLRRHRQLRVHPLEPANSPTMRTGHKVGRHRIQGISDEFVPKLVQLDELDRVLDVWDGDAILMAQALARELGLAVGISSGANFLGAVQLVEELGPDAVVVTLLPDSNKKYLSTDLCGVEPVKDGYLSPQVELITFTAYPCPAL